MAPTSYGDHRLPSGRHTLSPEEVAANQRWRLIGAASEALAERRLVGVTARLISHRAAVSNYTFYEHFSGVDDVLVAAFSLASKLLLEAVGAACDERPNGESALENALAAALAFGAREPGMAALFTLEVATGVPTVAGERERLLGRLEALLTGHSVNRGGKVSAPGRQLALGAGVALGVERLEAEPSLLPIAAHELTAMIARH